MRRPDQQLKASKRGRSNKLKAAYGLTQLQWDQLFSEQGQVCAICGTAQPRGNRDNWCVDHCHEHGHVRGILCSNCNSGMGFFKDSPETIAKAYFYLRTRVGPSDELERAANRLRLAKRELAKTATDGGFGGEELQKLIEAQECFDACLQRRAEST